MSNQKKLLTSYIAFYFLIVLLSYTLNFGWLRFFGIIIFIPYLIWLIVVNVSYLRSFPFNNYKVKDLRTLFFSSLSFILFNIFLSDGGDIGPQYYFFGLLKVQSDFISNITANISFAFLVIHLFFHLKQVKELKKLKKLLV